VVPYRKRLRLSHQYMAGNIFILASGCLRYLAIGGVEGEVGSTGNWVRWRGNKFTMKFQNWGKVEGE
jgi:hypothetical protein